eukprot:2721831-Prymnesium_polylepis.2
MQPARTLAVARTLAASCGGERRRQRVGHGWQSAAQWTAASWPAHSDATAARSDRSAAANLAPSAARAAPLVPSRPVA